jgi:WD40 repeat protein
MSIRPVKRFVQTKPTLEGAGAHLRRALMRDFAGLSCWVGYVLVTACGLALACRLSVADEPKEVASFSNPTENPFGTALSTDRKTFAWAATDKSVRVWDMAGTKERFKLEHPDEIGAIGFNPDGTVLASACKDGKIRFWDVTTGKEQGSIDAGHKLIAGYPRILFTPDGKTLLSTNFNADGLCFLWDVEKRKEQRPLLAPKGGSQIVLSYAFSPDGKAVTVFAYERVYLFETDTGKLLCDFVPKDGGTTGSALVSADGKQVVYLSKGLRAVDVKTGEERAPLGKEDPPYALTYGPGGRLLAFAALDDKESKVWDALTGKELATWKKPAGQVRSLAFGADGKLTAVVFNKVKKKLELWDLPNTKIDDK